MKLQYNSDSWDTTYLCQEWILRDVNLSNSTKCSYESLICTPAKFKNISYVYRQISHINTSLAFKRQT